MLQELNCPTCGAPGLEVHQPDGVVMCKFCGNRYSADNEVVCAQCETLNSDHVLFCQNCGAKLKRTCAACNTENWAGAEYCSACGRDLDMIANMSARTRDTYAARLEEHRQNAPSLKAEQEAQSKKVSDALWEAEAKRQAELAAQRERQRIENNRIMTGLMIGGVVLLVFILCGVVALSVMR